MSTPEFIASYWTLAGNVVPLGPPEQEASGHDLSERLPVAAAAGYSGIGLMRSDLLSIRQRYDFPTIRSMLADHGMKYLELEFLVGWIADGDELAESEVVFNDMLEAAENLDVRHVKVGPDMNATEWPIEHMAERFAGLCDRAAAAGTSVSLELMPWSNITDIETAVAVVDGAGRANGGLLLDIWHIARGGISYAEIADIPAGLVNYVEINDADTELVGTLLEDTLNHRKFCGDGDLDVPRFLDVLAAYGYNGPFGIEIISEQQRARPYADVANDAIRTAKREFGHMRTAFSG
jgi:sugar phosphate isomerase/epimerase